MTDEFYVIEIAATRLLVTIEIVTTRSFVTIEISIFDPILTSSSLL